MSITLITSKGGIKIELECEKVPVNTKNFLALCASGYYDNTIFHRNIPGFIIQGGDPSGKGRGGVSSTGNPIEDEIDPTLLHSKRGIVSMANSGPNTNQSQFFITYGKQKHLDQSYTIIGRVIDGFDALELLEREPRDSSDKPLNECKIFKVQIHANPIADIE